MSQTNIWPLIECLWEQAISLPSSMLTPFTSDNFQIRNFFEVSGLSSIVYFSKHHKASGIFVFMCWGPPCNWAWIRVSLFFTSTLFLSLWCSPVSVWVTGRPQSFWMELKPGHPGPHVMQPLSLRDSPPCFSAELTTAILLEHLQCKEKGAACPSEGPQFCMKVIQKCLGEGNQHILAGNVSKGKIQHLISSGLLILHAVSRSSVKIGGELFCLWELLWRMYDRRK